MLHSQHPEHQLPASLPHKLHLVPGEDLGEILLYYSEKPQILMLIFIARVH